MTKQKWRCFHCLKVYEGEKAPDHCTETIAIFSNNPHECYCPYFSPEEKWAEEDEAIEKSASATVELEEKGFDVDIDKTATTETERIRKNFTEEGE